MTLAYYGKSRKRGVGLALAAILAIILGTVGAVSLQGGSARADADQTQLNLSDSACVAGGINLHFVAPHADSGSGGTISGTYTLNGGATLSFGPVAEDTTNNSANAQWNVMLSGSGTFHLLSATAGTGDVHLIYDGNGGDQATRSCGTQTAETGTLTVIKHVVDAPSGVTAADYTLTVSQDSTVVKSGSGVESPGTTYTLDAGTYVVAETGGTKADSVGFSGACDASGTVTVTAGGSATCTITNTFNASTLELQPLVLTSMCSDNPDVSRHWRVRNTNSVDVPFTWEVYGTAQTGSGTATANSDVFFDTQTVAGANTTKIYWMSNGVQQSTVKASGGVACEPSTLTGSITINKHFVEADGKTEATDNLPIGVDFTYTGADGGGSFTLNAAKSWTWNLPDAPVGYYHFDEAAIDGWHTVNVHCYSSAAAPRALAAPEADASFTVHEGESWTCDFTNQRVEQSSQTYTVTVEKYISDALATTGSFSLSSTTTASNVPTCETGCTNPFTLDSSNGWMATTTAMAAGSQYSVVEPNVPTSAGACTTSDTYYLAGYHVGTDVANAMSNPLEQSASITDLQSNMVVIVVNQLCQQSNVGGTITVVKQWKDANGSQTTDNLPTDVTFTYGENGTIVVNSANGWTADATNVAPGHYEVSEPTLDGWHVISAKCTKSDTKDAAPVEASASFTLNEGEHWTCTFVNQANATNSQTYTVTIAKYISGNHATAADTNSASFNMAASWTMSGTPDSGTYALGPTGFNTPNAYEAVTSPMAAGDMYATNETGVPMSPGACTADTPYYLAGYRVSDTSMADAASAELSMTSPSFTNLQSNEYVIVVNQPCQAQNLVGSITIVKSWEDANGSQVSVDSSQIASFTGTGTGVDSSFDLTSAGNYRHQFFGLSSGTYSFTESAIPGWTLTGITCEGNTLSTPTFDVPNSMLNIDFNNTEGMTCTFHNQQQTTPKGAMLTIVKEWRDANGDVMESGFGTAHFTSDVTGHESFMLGTNNTSAPDMNQRVITGLAANTYHFTEIGQNGWNYVSTTCTNNALQPTSSLVANSSFGVVVPENGDITCTVVNQAVATGTTGSITIMKQWVNNDMTPLPADLIPAEGATFTASGTGVSGFSLPMSNAWSNLFSGLAAGTFGFNENTVTGFTLLTPTCTDNANSSSVAFTLNSGMYEAALVAGQNITCTFVNQADTQLATFVPPTFTFIPAPAVVTTPTASPSATQSPSATTTTAPTTVPTNTGNESPVTNTNTGGSSQPSTLNNNAPSANNAVAGVQAPGAPSTGSGSAMSSTGNTLAIALGLVTIAASAAAFAFSRKDRS